MLSSNMDIFRVRPDKSIKVGSIRLNKKSLSSESELMAALKDSVKDLDDGMYSVHPADKMFARFKLTSNSIKLERRSENTGVMMPCWNNFEK
jgi:hypothetical protein